MMMVMIMMMMVMMMMMMMMVMMMMMMVVVMMVMIIWETHLQFSHFCLLGTLFISLFSTLRMVLAICIKYWNWF